MNLVGESEERRKREEERGKRKEAKALIQKRDGLIQQRQPNQGMIANPFLSLKVSANQDSLFCLPPSAFRLPPSAFRLPPSATHELSKKIAFQFALPNSF